MSDSIKKHADDLWYENRTMYPGDIKVTSYPPKHTSSPPKEDKYVKKVVKKYKQRSKVGIEKYNTTLEREDLSLLEWLTHLQEELMDATLYIEKLKDFAKKDS